MQVANRSPKKTKGLIGALLIVYSLIHYLLFGLDIWVVLFLCMGFYWALFAGRKSNDTDKETKDSYRS